MYKCIAKCPELDCGNLEHCNSSTKRECFVGNKPIWVKREEKVEIILDKELAVELNDAISQLYELFNIAYNLNQSENTRTAFSQKTTTYIGGVLQTLQYIKGQLPVED